MYVEVHARGKGTGRMVSDDPPRVDPSAEGLEQRVARLTKGQLDCLLLVDQHLSSKEIAGELGISSHTVDQRVRQALHILGVERRAQAARIVARHRPPYQRLIHQSPHIEASPAGAHPNEAISNQIRHADRAGGALEAGSIPSRGRFRGPSCNRRSRRGATPAMR